MRPDYDRDYRKSFARRKGARKGIGPMTRVRCESKTIDQKGYIVAEGGSDYWSVDELLDYFQQKIDWDGARVLVFRRKGDRKLKVIITDNKTDDATLTHHFSFVVLSGDRKALHPLIAEAMKHAKRSASSDA